MRAPEGSLTTPDRRAGGSEVCALAAGAATRQAPETSSIGNQQPKCSIYPIGVRMRNKHGTAQASRATALRVLESPANGYTKLAVHDAVSQLVNW